MSMFHPGGSLGDGRRWRRSAGSKLGQETMAHSSLGHFSMLAILSMTGGDWTVEAVVAVVVHAFLVWVGIHRVLHIY